MYDFSCCSRDNHGLPLEKKGADIAVFVMKISGIFESRKISVQTLVLFLLPVERDPLLKLRTSLFPVCSPAHPLQNSCYLRTRSQRPEMEFLTHSSRRPKALLENDSSHEGIADCPLEERGTDSTVFVLRGDQDKS